MSTNNIGFDKKTKQKKNRKNTACASLNVPLNKSSVDLPLKCALIRFMFYCKFLQ